MALEWIGASEFPLEPTFFSCKTICQAWWHQNRIRWMILALHQHQIRTLRAGLVDLPFGSDRCNNLMSVQRAQLPGTPRFWTCQPKVIPLPWALELCLVPPLRTDRELVFCWNKLTNILRTIRFLSFKILQDHWKPWLKLLKYTKIWKIQTGLCGCPGLVWLCQLWAGDTAAWQKALAELSSTFDDARPPPFPEVKQNPKVRLGIGGWTWRVERFSSFKLLNPSSVCSLSLSHPNLNSNKVEQVFEPSFGR